MLKFMVVIYRKPDLTSAQFRAHLENVHAPLVKALPGIRRYLQNYASPDANRKLPGWDAIVEVYFDSYDAMQAAWASPQGRASDADLPLFTDLTRTTWSVVEEVTVLR
jgi:uncharacterized protein (TIGR02118 family)